MTDSGQTLLEREATVLTGMGRSGEEVKPGGTSDTVEQQQKYSVDKITIYKTSGKAIARSNVERKG